MNNLEIKHGINMLKKLENIFIWACGIAFLVAALGTLIAFIIGVCIGFLRWA